MTISQTSMSNSTPRTNATAAGALDHSQGIRPVRSRPAHANSAAQIDGSLALAAHQRALLDTEADRRRDQPYPVAEFQRDGHTRLSKRFLETLRSVVRWSAAAAITTSLLPAFAGIGAAILICDGRPLFYRQYRVGKDGRLFRIWKFRTMRPNAESTTGPVWCQQEDQRVTMIGRLLRASHLDELPQLFNVLRGDMNIVGPRPERPEFVQQLAQDIPGYLRRLQVKPGITGLAQIRQGYDTCLADVRRKVALDRFYIRHASLSFDAFLIAGTIPFVTRELFDRIRRRFAGPELEVEPPVLRIIDESPEPASEEPCARGITPADIERVIQAMHEEELDTPEFDEPTNGSTVAPPHRGFTPHRSAGARAGSRPTPSTVPYSHLRPDNSTTLPANDDHRSA